MTDTNKKQLVLVVEGTAALGPYWLNILSDYLEKVIRSIQCNGVSLVVLQQWHSAVEQATKKFEGMHVMPAQCGSASGRIEFRSFCDDEVMKPASPTVELALVMFNAHGSYSPFLVRRSGWTRNMDFFLEWLTALDFTGGGFCETAIAEGLAEVLMMFPSPNGDQTEQHGGFQRHCILVAASNPYPLPTPVYRPTKQKLEPGHNSDMQSESHLSDAETVAKSFPQSFISLSVICPKQLPKLKAIYNVVLGNRDTSVAGPIVIVRNPGYLVLISEAFVEALAALSGPGITNMSSNQNPVKMDATSVSRPPPTPVSPENGSPLNQQPLSVGNIPPATEPSTVSSIASTQLLQHVLPVGAASQGVSSSKSSSPLSTSQEMILSNDIVQDLKPVLGGIQQPMRPANVSILNNLSQARLTNPSAFAGGMSIGLSSVAGNSLISRGMTSSVIVAPTVTSSVQSSITTMTGSATSATSKISESSGLATSQPLGNLQGKVSMAPSLPVVNQGNLQSPQMVQSGTTMNQNLMTGVVQSAMPARGTMISTPGVTQEVQGIQSAQPKYAKVWEGNLSGMRQGQSIIITRLEAYRSSSSSESIAENWPSTMQIVRLVSESYIHNKQFAAKADFLVFRALNQHGFLGQLQEKKLCAVIVLSSQTLLLSVSDKACRLIGMLFPEDMVVFKPQISEQLQLVGTGMNEGSGAGDQTQSQSQSVSHEQISSQNKPGGSFVKTEN